MREEEEVEEEEAGIHRVIVFGGCFRLWSIQTDRVDSWVFCCEWLNFGWDAIATPGLRRRTRNCEELLASGFLERVSGLVSHVFVGVGVSLFCCFGVKFAILGHRR